MRNNGGPLIIGGRNTKDPNMEKNKNKNNLKASNNKQTLHHPSKISKKCIVDDKQALTINGNAILYCVISLSSNMRGEIARMISLKRALSS